MSATPSVRLAHFWPSQKERDFFYNEGYLVVPDALSAEEVDRLTAAIDCCTNGKQDQFINRIDILGLDNAFLSLIDNPKVFAKICGFLGWNIWVNHTHFNIRPPDPRNEPYRYSWHRDGGTFSMDLQGDAPMTAIKVGFYLNDLTEPGRGNTYLIPLHADNPKIMDQLSSTTPPPPEAHPLLLKPGSAVIFQQRAIHSQGSPNYSDTIRKTIFIQWAFRWLFPVDTMTVGHLADTIENPIRRQLLGIEKSRPQGCFSSRYYPSEQEIPLKKWLMREVGMLRLGEVSPATMRYLTRFLNFDL